MARVMVMAGGTGGHVFPALAVARRLRERGHEVFWLGNRKGMEATLVPQAGFDMEWTQITGLRGKGLLNWLRAPLALLRAIVEALAIVRRRQPDVAVGMGGFVSGPGGLATRLTGRPLLIHEQNAVPGLANRSLAKIASTVVEAFPDSFNRSGVRVCGNPVRAEIATLPTPEQRFAGRAGAVRLLVLGGSLGALRLNEMLPQALARIAAESRPEVWHQSGARTLDTARLAYENAGVHARLEPFIDDMAAAYRWADFVICRAGALTLSELAAAGLGALLVPYPYAVDDHQSANARWLQQAGAGQCLKDADFAPEPVAAFLQELDRPKALRMAQAARSLALPNADVCVADAVEALL